jgi:K+-sensing histidine kinase KdpD
MQLTMEQRDKFTILYVDDEDSNLNIFKNTFRREYNVLIANSAQKGLEMLKNEHIDLILTDQRMPDMDGVSFLKHTLDSFPELNRILITGYTDFDALRTAINEAKIFQYIQKPWKEDQLRNVIDKALEIYQLRQENQSLNNQLLDKNKELEKINAELLEFDKLKTEFLSLISHEIRTPLNGIMGSVDLLKQDMAAEGSNSISTLIYILETSVNRLEKFLLSAERITQLKAGNYDIRIETHSPKEFFNEVFTRRIEDIHCKGCTVKTKFDNVSGFTADKNLATFCLNEIIDNALKFSPPKSQIEIYCYQNENWVVFEVNDEGSGFPEKTLRNPFQLFASDGHSDQQIGLSLALVKLIMDSHNGKIEIDNNKNGGAMVKLFFQKA